MFVFRKLRFLFDLVLLTRRFVDVGTLEPIRLGQLRKAGVAG
jgi:hypothetical protein